MTDVDPTVEEETVVVEETTAVDGNAQPSKAAKKKKKKRKKKKKKGHAAPKVITSVNVPEMKERFANVDLEVKKEPKDHKFWHSQPVLKMEVAPAVEELVNEPIETLTLADVRKEPLDLPAGYEWTEVDVDDDAEMTAVYNLLRGHYVTDDDQMFRFNYPISLLRWAIKPPGWKKYWHIAIRSKKDSKLLAFITAVPATIRCYDKLVPMVEINFLCVHKKLRSRNLAAVLIKEIRRRVNCTDVWQAVYTAGVVLPSPVASCRYHHRSLNPKKLIEVSFSHLGRNMTMKRLLRLYALPQKPTTVGLRPLEQKDVSQACNLLNKFLDNYHVAPQFDDAEFAHWFLPREGVIYSYVVEDPKSKAITDMFSFYALPSSILNHEKHKDLNAAYSFYNVAGSMSWPELMKDALIVAKSLGFDVFNCLDVMENEKFLTELQFGKGDGKLQYYLFNWKCQQTRPEGVGLVLM